MAKGRIHSITYTWNRIIAGFLNTSFNGLFTTALAAGGAGVPAEGASGLGVALATAMATALIAGSRAVLAEGASCPGAALATAMVTSFVGEDNESAPAAPADTAVGASSPVEGVSTTFRRWGLGKEDEGLQNRVVISIQQNNSITSQLDRYLPGEVSGASFAFLHLPTPPGDQRRVVGQLHG
jgi:hypothetical protein